MTPEEKAAVIVARSVACFADLCSMQAANHERLGQGLTMAYGEKAFSEIAQKHEIDHNSVWGFLTDA